jgi:hypothetical protein
MFKPEKFSTGYDKFEKFEAELLLYSEEAEVNEGTKVMITDSFLDQQALPHSMKLLFNTDGTKTNICKSFREY